MGVRADKSGRRQRPTKAQLRQVEQVKQKPAPLALLVRTMHKSVHSELEDLLEKNLDLLYKNHGFGQKVLVYAMRKPTRVYNPENGPVTQLWHGTSGYALASIIYTKRIIPSNHGLLGPGVYLGKRPKAFSFLKGSGVWLHPKATDTAVNDILGVLLECDVALGPCLEIDETNIKHETGWRNRISPEDMRTRFGKKDLTPVWGGALRYDEWAVRDPRRISVQKVHLFLKTELRPTAWYLK